MKRLLRQLQEANRDSSRNVTATSRTPLRDGLGVLGLVLATSVLLSLVARFSEPAPWWFLPVALATGLGAVTLAVQSYRPSRHAGPSRVAVSGSGVSFAWGARSEHVPWAEVDGLEVGPDGARLRTARGDREIPAHLLRWRAAAAAIAMHLAPTDAPADPELSTAVIEQWLGGREVVCRRTSPWYGLGHASLYPLVTLALFGAMALRAGPSRWPALAAVLAATLMAGLAIGAALTPLALGCTLSADATGLRRRTFRRTGRSCGWGDVVGVEREGSSWTILTTEGDFTLWAGDPNAARIVATAQHVLDARAHGQTLPRLAGMSDAALSPAAFAVEAERGLSSASTAR